MKILLLDFEMYFFDGDSIRLSKTLFDNLLLEGCRISNDDIFTSLLLKRGIEMNSEGFISIEENFKEILPKDFQKHLERLYRKVCSALEEAAEIKL